MASSAFSFFGLLLASSDRDVSSSSHPGHDAANVTESRRIVLTYEIFLLQDVPPSPSRTTALLTSGERLRLRPRGLGWERRFGAIVDAGSRTWSAQEQSGPPLRWRLRGQQLCTWLSHGRGRVARQDVWGRCNCRLTRGIQGSWVDGARVVVHPRGQ